MPSSRVFGRVVARRRGAVQVHIVDVVRLRAGTRQRVAHRHGRARAIRVRRAHVMAVAALAMAEQPVLGCFGFAL